jgi:hypothetical protein
MFRLISRMSFGIAIFAAGLVDPSVMAQAPAGRGQMVAVPPGAAAVVDGHTISRDEVENVAVRRFGQEVLDRLVDSDLINREADRLHVTASEAEIGSQVEALENAIKSAPVI